MPWLIALPLLALVFNGARHVRAAKHEWQGVWRWLGMLPLLAIGGDVLFIIVGTAIDRTSHNLWPFELMVTTGASLMALGALALLHKFMAVR